LRAIGLAAADFTDKVVSPITASHARHLQPLDHVAAITAPAAALRPAASLQIQGFRLGPAATELSIGMTLTQVFESMFPEEHAVLRGNRSPPLIAAAVASINTATGTAGLLAGRLATALQTGGGGGGSSSATGAQDLNEPISAWQMMRAIGGAEGSAGTEPKRDQTRSATSTEHSDPLPAGLLLLSLLSPATACGLLSGPDSGCRQLRIAMFEVLHANTGHGSAAPRRKAIVSAVTAIITSATAQGAGAGSQVATLLQTGVRSDILARGTQQPDASDSKEEQAALLLLLDQLQVCDVGVIGSVFEWQAATALKRDAKSRSLLGPAPGAKTSAAKTLRELEDEIEDSIRHSATTSARQHLPAVALSRSAEAVSSAQYGQIQHMLHQLGTTSPADTQLSAGALWAVISARLAVLSDRATGASAKAAAAKEMSLLGYSLAGMKDLPGLGGAAASAGIWTVHEALAVAASRAPDEVAKQALLRTVHAMQP
jgi:hypothetical protein